MPETLALSWPVAAAVLFGALLHAGWNALLKSSSDKSLDTALIHLIGSLLAIPLALLAGWPPAAAWPYLIASLAIHIGYYFALAGAYKHGDLSFAYPLMRGSAPLLVALAATLGLGERLSGWAWAGLLGICCGVLALGFTRQALASPKALGFALGNAVLIALYTVVDALGVRASGNAFAYVATLFLLDGWPFALLVWARRGSAFPAYARWRWPLATIGAAASLLSYGIALWAMTQAPMAMVAALRETAVLFAVLLGGWFLKEAFTTRRLVGVGAIVCGVVALRLG
jgi:phosphonate utilization associated putative membrane protein